MKYKITTHCCWFRGGSMIVKMYFINGMPFTFDELPDGHLEDQELIPEIQHNLQTGIYTSGPLSTKYETGVAYFHDLIINKLNRELNNDSNNRGDR